MIQKTAYLFLLIFLISCGDSVKSEADLLDEISTMEKKVNDPKTAQSEIDKSRLAYIDALKSLYENYPESKEAARSLDKLHMVYTNLGDYQTATKYCDTLIQNYPKYDNRALVLESAASAYDASIMPRDTTMVRKYYTMLLNEFPKLEASKRADIKKRLEFISLDFMQFIQVQARDNVE